MKRLIIILLIFLTFSLLQFGQQEKAGTKPKIGLLTFSVNAFDEESKKINASLKALKGVIEKELKKKFEIVGYPPGEITYSDIELPEVTIDPVVEPETNKKLEKLCQKDWDGLVFGHFHQEGKLVVVTRFYLSKNKYPGLKKDERIISSQEIEIPTTNLGKKPLEEHTTESIEKLIKTIETKKPEVFGLVKKEVKKEPPSKVTEPPKEEPKPTKQDTRPTQTKKKPGIKVDYEVVPLTARNVYQMISDNGFYCEKYSGSSFHGEALNTFKKIKGKVFPYMRTVTATKNKKNNLVKTKSRSRKKKTNEKEIVLEWSPKPIECSFQEALDNIAHRNKIKTDKNKKWRIPTIMEVFSIIVKGKKKNYFPPGFQLPGNKSIFFWTSTPLKKEGTSLEYDKANKAYFVVQLVFLPDKDEYSLRFHFQNIDQKYIEGIYLLPVYSDKVYAYRKNLLPTDTKVPGFDDKYVPGFDDPPDKNISQEPVPSTSPEKKAPTSKKSPNITPKSSSTTKIPGFDDVPPVSNKNSSPKVNASKTPRKLPTTKIKISLIPYFWKGMHGSTKEQELYDINFDIETLLKELKKHVREHFYCELIIDNKRADGPKNVSLFTKFYNIIQPNQNERILIKAGIIANDIMGPNNIDILVSVLHGMHMKGVEYLKPLIISQLDNTVDTGKNNEFVHTRKGRGRLKKYVIKIIKEILYSNLSR